jgi:hypothetical protein
VSQAEHLGEEFESYSGFAGQRKEEESAEGGASAKDKPKINSNSTSTSYLIRSTMRVVGWNMRGFGLSGQKNPTQRVQ